MFSVRGYSIGNDCSCTLLVVDRSSTTKYERQLKLDMRAKRKGRKSKRKSPVDVSDPANDDVVFAKVPKVILCLLNVCILYLARSLSVSGQ